MGLKLKKAKNKNFAWLPPKKNSDLFMFHTQVQVCKKLDNSVGEKNQLIFKSLPRTVKTNWESFFVDDKVNNKYKVNPHSSTYLELCTVYNTYYVGL
jgi:hypothetical protein